MDSRYAGHAGMALDGGSAGDWAASRLRGSPRSRDSVELAGDGGPRGSARYGRFPCRCGYFMRRPGRVSRFRLVLPETRERRARSCARGTARAGCCRAAYRERRVAIGSRRLLTGREIYVEFGVSSRGSARFVRSAGRRGGVYGESSSVGQSTGLWIQGSGVRVPSFTLFCVRR